MQKLRWTERGWSRGFSYCSWKFQSGSGVGGDDREQVEGSGLRLGRRCALGDCGGGANGLRFAPTEREFGGAGPNGCAAWPRHAGLGGRIGRHSRHGPWAHFGESWRTNIRRPLRQQGQTRGSSDVFGSADGSAASAPIRPRGCVVCRSRRSSRRARAASLRLAGCQRPK